MKYFEDLNYMAVYTTPDKLFHESTIY